MADVQQRNGERTPKHDRLVESLSELVRSMGLRPGERLPAERDLALRLGVTRGDVRRAVGYLAALGVLEVRHGVGAFLARQPGGLGAAPLEVLRAVGGFETWQMFEARRALETEVASLAAKRRQDSDLLTLTEELEEMSRSLGEAGEFLVHDVRFHRAIAQAAGNPILAAVMEVIASALYKERESVVGTHANRVEALTHHQAIFAAIATHDSTAARRSMQHHLTSAESMETERK